MRKKTAKTIAIIIALLMVLGLLAPLVGTLVYGAPSDETVQEYEREQKSALATMQELEGQMNDASEKVYQLEQQLAATQKSLDAAEEELSAVEEVEMEKKEKFRERFAAMCDGGTASYLDMLLSAESLSDFIDRVVIVREMTEYDRNILNSVSRVKEEIVTAKQEQESLKAKQEEDKRQLSETMEELYQKSAEAAAYYKEISQNKEIYQQYLEEKEAAEQATKARAGIVAGEGSASADQISGDYFLWPTNVTTITSSFSPNRVNPVSGVVRPHTGTDIGASEGAPVWAAQGGTVALAERNGGYGNCIIIDHGNGVRTLYGHLSAILVTQGQTVNQGDQIGRVGSTGNSTGPHLHFEVILNGTAVDAMQFFSF